MQDPVSDSAESPALDQQFLLSMYRLAVDYYQPKIERRTRVQLGPIKVWEHAELWRHRLEDYKKSLGFIGSLLRRRQIRQYADAARDAFEDRARTTSAVYYRNAIYISFASGSDHEDWIARIVVHELAHALWEKLGGPFSGQCDGLSDNARQQLKFLEEGYATFAEREWFKDLYPLHARVRPTWDPSGVRERGAERISQIVKDRGSQVLWEIPSRWREF